VPSITIHFLSTSAGFATKDFVADVRALMETSDQKKGTGAWDAPG
jgi:hypothetical protein